MHSSTITTTMTAEERERELADQVRLVRRWPGIALVQQRSSGDEELWSLSRGFLVAPLCLRIAGERRRGFALAHRQAEQRLWQSVLTAAARYPAGADSPSAGSDDAGRTADRRALAAALRAYRRAGSAPRQTIPAATRHRVLAAWEAGGRHCAICGLPVQPGERPDLDHAVPLAAGGSDEAGNLRAAHAACNQRRGAQYLPDEAVPAQLELRFERPHPSPHALLVCRACGAPSAGYIDVPRLPTLRVCARHWDRRSVLTLLQGFGAPAASLETIRYHAPPSPSPA